MKSYRIPKSSNREQFYQLYLYAFNRTDTDERRNFFNYRYEHADIYGYKNKDILTAGLYSLPFMINLHGVNYRMNGIGDVMSAPENNDSSNISTLIYSALKDMVKQNITLSYLAPFSYSYYRRFGYEQVFNHLHYQIPSDKIKIPKFPDATGIIKRLPLIKALPIIMPFYQQQALNLAGGLVRSSWWWEYLTLKHHWDVAIYYTKKQIQGYIIYERKNQELIIQEFYYHTPKAYQQLLKFILKHRNSFATISYDSPNIEYRGDWYLEPTKLQTFINPYMMVRIINLADFVLRYPFIKNDFQSITFTVLDEVISQNNGKWQLSRCHGKTTFHKISESSNTTDCAISIQQLTKAFFGTTTMLNIYLQGQTTFPLNTVKSLDQILVHEQPQFNDYF